MIIKMLNKKIKNFKYEALQLEKEARSDQNTGECFVKSTDQWSLTQLIKLHYTVSTIKL